MTVSPQEMQTWCETLLAGRKAAPDLTLADYLDDIPSLGSLDDLESGSVVLVRGDLDAKPGATIGDGDIRLRSMVDTLDFGRQRGWKQVVFGHIGRKPEGSLAKVAKRLGELLECEVTLISDWFDDATTSILPAVAQQIAAVEPGSVILLENTRKYAIETVLWKAKPADLPNIAPKLAKLANEFAKLSTTYVFEALSAGSLDACTVAVPIAMDRVALGSYVEQEFTGPMMQCLEAKLVAFSGLKADKLDDLEAIVGRGKVKHVFAAGSLAMALRKAAGEIDGKPVCIGAAEDPSHSDKPYFIPADRVAQAKQMIIDGRKKGIEFVLPIDSVITDGSAADELKPQDQQFDIGPKTSALFEKKVGEFIAANKGAAAFHNGVFGMFEDSKFEDGTRKWMHQLKRMTDGGVEVYVGGGEGGAALEKYGSEDWVTHVFTAGGTVLNALGSEPVPYLVALRNATLQNAASK